MTQVFGPWPAIAITALALVLSARSADDTPARSTEASTPPPSASAGTPTVSSSSTTSPNAEEESALQIQITIGDQSFTADLEDSAASRDLVAQLPTTLDMRDHGSVEKTGRLRAPLSLSGQPSGADPDVGDVGYYAPGNDLVLYYGDQSYYEGIVVLGRMEDGAADRIADMDGTVSVTVTAAGQDTAG
jgi:hypothetical protein